MDSQINDNDQNVENMERNILKNVELEPQVATNMVKMVTLSKTVHF